MTVKRQGYEIFEGSKSSLEERVLSILQSDPQYREIRVDSDHHQISLHVKPHWWLLSTQMVIQFELQEGNRCGVLVRTTSQPYILGDVLGYYQQYINEFFVSLKRAFATQPVTT